MNLQLTYQEQHNKEYYQKNKDKIKDRILSNLKNSNYRVEKTRKQKLLRYIKRRTRELYPIKDRACEVCYNRKATERHHVTEPIRVDRFLFICHPCHIFMDTIRRKSIKEVKI